MTPPKAGRARLDNLLVELGLAPSRARARDAILRASVTVDGTLIAKPGAMVARDAQILLNDPASGYVSRAALKLAHALDVSGFDPAGRVALDVGASTGGFTQVLLSRGAARVYAVDVGHGQLHQSLRADARVHSLEGVNARTLSRGQIPEPVSALVADVSFISLKLALPAALELCDASAWLAVLVKPQFELGKAALNSAGVVADAGAARGAADMIAAWIAERGWTVTGIMSSPLLGGSGNREFLVTALRIPLQTGYDPAP